MQKTEFRFGTKHPRGPCLLSACPLRDIFTFTPDLRNPAALLLEDGTRSHGAETQHQVCGPAQVGALNPAPPQLTSPTTE